MVNYRVVWCGVYRWRRIGVLFHIGAPPYRLLFIPQLMFDAYRIRSDLTGLPTRID